MADILKRIIVAQKPNILISDKYLRVILRNQGDSIDLLGSDPKGNPKYTLDQIAASKSLDGAIRNGDVKLYDETGNELSLLDQIKATNLSTLLENSSNGSSGGVGYSGYSGYSGFSGSNGSDGVSGFSGFSGQAGEDISFEEIKRYDFIMGYGW